MAKKIVISGYYGFGNFGDELILSILVNHLRQRDNDICVFSSTPDKTAIDNFVNAVKTFDLPKVTEQIRKSDILISGGGSLLQDVTSLKSIIYYLFVIFTALIYKKYVIIFAQGIGPVKNPIARFITKQLLKKCTYVSVRDTKSQELLSTWGINSELLCDPVFSLPAQESVHGGGIGIQLRPFKTLNDSLLDKLANQIVKEFSDKKIKLLSLQNHTDLELCKTFQRKLKSINPDISTKIIDKDIIEEISKLDYLISMRLHALIVGIKYGVKCLGINYDIKIEKLAQESGLPILSIDGKDDFNNKFEELKNLNTNNLKKYVEKQNFNWDNIDKIIYK